MEKLEVQIHLRNIVSCLKEIGDHTHYLSYDRYLLDNELKQVIFSNLTLAAHEANSLYKQGCKIEGLQYLAGLTNPQQMEAENYAFYSLLRNDVDYLTEIINAACEKEQELSKDPVPAYC